MLDSDLKHAPEPSSEAPLDGRVPMLAFVADEASETALRGGLLETLSDPKVRRGDVRTAVKVLEKEPSPRVVLVDVAGLEHPLESLEQLAHVCAPDVKVLVIGDRTDIEFYRDLIWGLHVTEYLPSRSPATRLPAPSPRRSPARSVIQCASAAGR